MCSVLDGISSHHNNKEPMSDELAEIEVDGWDDQKDDALTPWEHSNAKKQLIQDIVDGLTEGKKPKEIYESRPGVYKTEYCSLDKFRSRLYTLKETLPKHIDRKKVDEQGLLHDMALGMGERRKPYPIFKGSLVEELVVLDIEDGKHERMGPKEFHQSRDAYKAWPVNVFRDHIYQILRDKRKRPYWTALAKAKCDEKIRKKQSKAKAKLDKQKKQQASAAK